MSLPHDSRQTEDGGAEMRARTGEKGRVRSTYILFISFQSPSARLVPFFAGRHGELALCNLHAEG